MRKMIVVIAMGLATAAQAQDAPRPMMSPECRAEMQTLCPQADNREARRTCMAAKRDTLTPKCKDEMAAMRKAREARGDGERGPRPEGGSMGGIGEGDQGSPQ